MTDRNYHDEFYATQQRIKAESAAAAHAAGEERRAFRKAHWRAKEAELAADRRREAGITADDYEKVEYFLRWLKHVDQLRVAGKMPEAVAAWRQMHAEIDKHDPPDENAKQKLYAFAAREANVRHRFGDAEDQLLKPGYWGWSTDVRLGFYKHLTVEPKADAKPDAKDAAKPAANGSAT